MCGRELDIRSEVAKWNSHMPRILFRIAISRNCQSSLSLSHRETKRHGCGNLGDSYHRRGRCGGGSSYYALLLLLWLLHFKHCCPVNASETDIKGSTACTFEDKPGRGERAKRRIGGNEGLFWREVGREYSREEPCPCSRRVFPLCSLCL